MPTEIDFSKAVRRRHYIPVETTVFCPLPSKEVFGNISTIRRNGRVPACYSFSPTF
jgi:hypothetical protein